MKILYGVQGTGNGHLSRAHAMATALANYPDVEVTWLISGRPIDQLFEVMPDFLWRRGLTFKSEDGRVRYLSTFLSNNYFELVRDALRLDVRQYDHICIDYEPVTAWAARFAGRETLGIGHQYAFRYPVPVQGDTLLTRLGMNAFAPATESLGLHWHHFNYPVLPPIIDLAGYHRETPVKKKVVVYLPFEDQARVVRLLRALPTHQFFVYGPGLTHQSEGHVHTRALCRDGFKQDLVSAEAVICNAGFELISECLSLGIRVLARPVDQQLEQLSNALALEELQYARVIYGLDLNAIGDWLSQRNVVQIDFGSVHEQIAAWLVGGRTQTIEDLAEETWADVTIHRLDKNSAAEAAA